MNTKIQWEYKVADCKRPTLRRPGDDDRLTDLILEAARSLGRDGWEMAATMPTEGGAAVFFKRPVTA